MSEENKDKHQQELEITYEDFFRQHLFEMLSLAKQIEIELGREKAHEIIRNWAERHYTMTTKKELSNSDEVIETFDDFKRWYKGVLSSSYWKTVLTYFFSGESMFTLECKITDCLYAKTMKELGDTDLGYSICCHGDFAVAKALHPKLRLERTKTLMQGDDHCNFKYSWEG